MSQGTILVVEDDANLLEGIRDILELEKFTILTAGDGEEGLGVLEKLDTAPDLIVSDIMMPNMNGIEFLTKVREDDRFVSVPFIYLTAKGEKSDIQEGKRLGVDDYVVKPFNADDLLVAIHSRLDRSRELDRVHTGREKELKNTILTILNHEFRTPLTFVVAYADMLSEVPNGNGGAGNNEDLLTFLDGVKNGADRLRRLIENFILLVELKTGSAEKTYQWRKQPIVDLPNLLQASIDQALAIPETQYTCILDAPHDLPMFVGDEEYLKTVIVHLVDNACKFSESNQVVNVRAFNEDNAIVIQVEDKGRGIPEDEKEKVWQEFYQINRKQYEDQGAGSGLTIVRGIAELHGGTATLESELGVGSTFTIRIPN